VPFTLAHAAAALPLRRFKLVWSALVVGTFAPDIQLFLGLSGHRESHRLPQLLTFSLPMGLVVLWIFHRLLKRPLVELAPDPLRIRLLPYLRRFEFAGIRRFGAIVLSLCIGIMTHLLWDSFTHAHTWAYEHWAWLRIPETIVILGHGRVILHCSLLQYASSIIGCAALAVWIVLWYRSTSPVTTVKQPVFTPARRVIIAAAMLCLPWILGLWLAAQKGHEPADFLHAKTFADYLVLLPGTMLWLELIMYGIFTTRLLKLQRQEH